MSLCVLISFSNESTRHSTGVPEELAEEVPLATEIATVSDSVVGAALVGVGGKVGKAEAGKESYMVGDAAEIVVMVGHLSIPALH